MCGGGRVHGVERAAQKPVTKELVTNTKSFEITFIDYATRLVTLRDADGNVDVMLCGPEVQRFDALKVGDKVTFRYYESVVFQIRKPGDTTPQTADNAGIARTPGDEAGRHTVAADDGARHGRSDRHEGAVRDVRTEDGRKMAHKVENAKNLEGVKVGDRVEITYTQALAISVK